jgi:phosphatidylcholine synthase
VHQRLPRFEGLYLDLIVDYFTYVIVPALFFYQSNVLPEGWRLFGAGLILVASQYHSGNLDQKTPDYYFRGFPAWWNVLVFYVWIFHFAAWVNLALVVFFSLATFLPILFLHPLRVNDWKPVTVAVTMVWSAANAAILLEYPHVDRWLIWVSLAGLAYLTGLCVARTARGAPFLHA